MSERQPIYLMTSLIHSNPGGTITNKNISSFKEFAKTAWGNLGHASLFCIIKTGRNWDTFIQPNLSGKKIEKNHF